MLFIPCGSEGLESGQSTAGVEYLGFICCLLGRDVLCPVMRTEDKVPQEGQSSSSEDAPAGGREGNRKFCFSSSCPLFWPGSCTHTVGQLDHTSPQFLP